MRLLRNALVVIAATGAMGSVHAQVPGNTFDLGTLTPNGVTKTDTFLSGSFSDTFNFTIDSTNRLVTASTVGHNVTKLNMGVYDSAGTLLYTGLNLQGHLTPGNFSAKISGDVVSSPGSFTFSVAANPEPAEWMLLLSGLLLAGFVARRKIGLVPGAPASA